MQRYLLIAAGAALGANLRYLVGLWALNRLGTAFPYGTLIVNISGSLILGVLVALLSDRIPGNAEMRLFFAIGFLGSYTTFSSFSVESLLLFENGGWTRGLLNFAGNNLLGLLAAWVGLSIGRLIV